MKRAALAYAALAGLTSDMLARGSPLDVDLARDDVPTPAQARRWRDRRNYPQSGTGQRQGERVARQVARALGDPFKASNECLARIEERLRPSGGRES